MFKTSCLTNVRICELISLFIQIFEEIKIKKTNSSMFSVPLFYSHRDVGNSSDFESIINSHTHTQAVIKLSVYSCLQKTHTHTHAKLTSWNMVQSVHLFKTYTHAHQEEEEKAGELVKYEHVKSVNRCFFSHIHTQSLTNHSLTYIWHLIIRSLNLLSFFCLVVELSETKEYTMKQNTMQQFCQVQFPNI